MPQKKKILTPDFCVIGAGSGGLSFAAGAVQMGASVVLLEGKKMGGDCLNAGCVPSKALIAASKIGDKITRSQDFGWSISKAQVDFKKVYKHIQDVISTIKPNDSVERFTKLGVKVILEYGSFIDPYTVETKTHLIKAKRFIIATGSIPFVPPLEGLSSIPFYTNESIFTLKDLPTHLLIIGGGPIGIELAQAFHRLGSEVSVLEAFTALPKDDPDLTMPLKNILCKEGISLQEGVKIEKIKPDKKGAQITYQTAAGKEKKLIVSHVLVATGRRPALNDLHLEKAGVLTSPKGIEVDATLRTSNKRIYAIGDCTGGYQFTHVAGYHAGLALRNSIFRLGSTVETRALPWVTYTDPELAHVGFLETQLKAQSIPYKILKMDFEDNDRAQAEKDTHGLIKILVTSKGKILGASILGSNAGELIYPWVIAIQNNLPLSAITKSIASYPTRSDLSKRVAGSFYTDKIFSPFMKKVVRILMRLTK